MKPYEVVAGLIREEGPMTTTELAAMLRWTRPSARRAIYRARAHQLLVVVGKLRGGHLVFGAVQTMADRYHDAA